MIIYLYKVVMILTFKNWERELNTWGIAQIHKMYYSNSNLYNLNIILEGFCLLIKHFKWTASNAKWKLC